MENFYLYITYHSTKLKNIFINGDMRSVSNEDDTYFITITKGGLGSVKIPIYIISLSKYISIHGQPNPTQGRL